jgi:hypothetical protein
MNKKAHPSIVRLGLHLLCPTTKLAHAPPFPGKVGAGGKRLINSLYLQSKISNQQSAISNQKSNILDSGSWLLTSGSCCSGSIRVTH